MEYKAHRSYELELAQSQIKELKTELDYDRRMRSKVESLNNALARELADERRARHTAEALCEELKEELARKQEEVDRLVAEIVEERRMMQIAEMWREERLQIKLAEARQLMEEKLQAAAMAKCKLEKHASKAIYEAGANMKNGSATGGQAQAQTWQQRKEVKNPHIKRGIKGFVEFPKVVKAQGSPKEGGRMNLDGSNFECQRAQLRTLLRQRNPAGIAGNSEIDFVM